MGSGPYHLIRVRVKGDYHHRQPELLRHLDGPAYDALMAPVHAVEDADRDHGATPPVRHVVQALPAVHVRNPSPGRSAATGMLAKQAWRSSRGFAAPVCAAAQFTWRVIDGGASPQDAAKCGSEPKLMAASAIVARICHRPMAALSAMKARYRYRIYPSPGQQQALARVFGCARVVFNDSLRLREARHAGGKKLSDAEVQRRGVTPAQLAPPRAWLGGGPPAGPVAGGP